MTRRTDIEEASDPSQLETLKHDLDQTQVYHWSEVEAFARVYYKPRGQQSAGDHAELERLVQPAADRFKALEETAERRTSVTSLAVSCGCMPFSARSSPMPIA